MANYFTSLAPLRAMFVCFIVCYVQVYGSCPDDWTMYGGQCYYLSKTSGSFSQAKRSCKSIDAELTSIRDAAENNFILREMQENGIITMWIGLHDITNEGNFTWIDGTPLNFTDWIHHSTGTSEPNSWKGGEEDCVDMKRGGLHDIVSGSWNDEHCTGRFRYMCKTDIQLCPEGWQEFNKRCYLFDHTIDSVLFEEAKKQCRLLDSQLVVIHSQEEQNFLADNIHEDPNDRWNYYHIGLHDTKTEGRFEWVDGTTVDFTAWTPGEPNDAAYRGEDCVGLWPERNGTWNDYPCNKLCSYICEKPLGSSMATTTVARKPPAPVTATVTSGEDDSSMDTTTVFHMPPKPTTAFEPPEGDVSLPASLLSSQQLHTHRSFVVTIAMLTIAVFAILVAWLATILYYRKKGASDDIQLERLTENGENM